MRGEKAGRDPRLTIKYERNYKVAVWSFNVNQLYRGFIPTLTTTISGILNMYYFCNSPIYLRQNY